MVTSILHRSLFVLFGALLFAATVDGPHGRCGAARADATTPAPAFTGKLLVATASMPDPDFVDTRILMLEHDDHGAIGVVINRARGSLDEHVTVLDGGPLHTQGWFALHDASYRAEGTRVLFGDVAVTSESYAQVLADALNGEGPDQVWLADTYAGWGPGQLEGELAMGVWRLEDRGALWE